MTKARVVLTFDDDDFARLCGASAGHGCLTVSEFVKKVLAERMATNTAERLDRDWERRCRKRRNA